MLHIPSFSGIHVSFSAKNDFLYNFWRIISIIFRHFWFFYVFLAENEYSRSAVQNEVTMDDLFADV
jgi:hypothetical protein